MRRENAQHLEAVFDQLRFPVGIACPGELLYANGALLALATPGASVQELVSRILESAGGSDGVGACLLKSEALGAGRAARVSVQPIEFGGRSAALLVFQELPRASPSVSDGEAIAVLAAGIAHDLRNPLTYMQMHLEALPDEERLRPHTEMLRVGLQQISQMVRSFAALLKSEAVDTEAFDASDALTQACQVVAHRLRTSAQLESRVGQGIRLRGSQVDLMRVASNLMINAVEAIEARGAGPGTIRLSLNASAGGEVVLTVEDDGIGIAPERLPQIYEPYFTSKPEKGGGLGLSIAREAAFRLGGEIQVDSEVGRGTRFRISFPSAR